MAKKKDMKNDMPRQEWNPHWVMKLLYWIWRGLFAAFKVVCGAAATVLLIGIVCGFVFVGVLGDYLQEDILPLAHIDLDSYEYEQNSYLYYVDSDGQIQEYQKVFAETSSTWVNYEDIPQNLINAAVAIEDHRFYEHQGVDWVTTVKATARMFFGDSSVGGSSITQQLIKNLLLTEDESADDVTVQRKVLEIFRAVQMERAYDKETIMELYLNFIYMGQGCRGVRSAAATYFGKELETLTLAECASLIGITNNPSLFDPYSDDLFTYKGEIMDGMQRNRYRQMLVLGAMLEYEMITQEEYDEAVAQEIVLKNGIDDKDRLAKCPNTECGYKNTVANFTPTETAYYCPVCHTETSVDKSASQANYSWFTDTVLEDVAKLMAEQNGMTWNSATKGLLMQQIQRGGYHIYTTLDMDVQKQVDAIYTDLSQIPKTRSGQQLQSAIVMIDNKTGDIVAMAGGVGAKEGFDDWNRATDAQLQSGSSIKPLSVYAPAFELGTVSPATVIKDLPNNYANGAYPLNDTRSYSFSRTIYSGVVSSVNAVAANTLEKIGINYAFEFARDKFGLSTLVESYTNSIGKTFSDIGMGPLALGAQTWGVTVRDMASAFATFANEGDYREGRTFTKVYDSEGNVILDNTQNTVELLSDKTVDYMNYCLIGGVNGGTGTAAKISGITTAGKTGTTGDNKDKWFCGFTGYYTAAVWCGYDSPEVISGVSGNPSAQLFKKVMSPLHSNKSDVSLYNSDKMVSVSVCLDCGKRATDACNNDIRVGLVDKFSRTASARVYSEDIPGQSCSCHVELDYCLTGKGVANEFCHKFAEVDPSVKIEKKALVKMTQSVIDEINKAARYNLGAAYRMDSYVYLVAKDGSDATFKGFGYDINQKDGAPYLVCTTHDQKAWETYQAAHPAEPVVPDDNTQTQPDPSKPTTPNTTP